MPIEATLVLGAMGVIAAMILTYIFIMPESKYQSLNPFCKWLSDLFNFRTLWLESIIKFFYVLSTVICVVFGVLLLITVQRIDYWDYTYTKSLSLVGLIVLIAGPVVVRLIYEGTMMFIILVKNTMQINNRLRSNKLEDKPKAEEKVISYAEPVNPAPVAPQPQINVCDRCGTKVAPDAVFCANCGNKVN
jgi:hypothetical protein